jgi:tRNA modification GTPase
MMSTIIAIATPAGRGAIGVVRLGGPDALSIARSVILDRKFDPRPGTVSLKNIGNAETNEVWDRALITYFKGPRSFTGEDIIEISCHGATVVMRQVLERAIHGGARLAEPGEFTLRALSNGKIDLSQAEAIRDLIDANTNVAARQALRQLEGELSFELSPHKERLLKVITILESCIEFVEDDLPPQDLLELKRDLEKVVLEVSRLAQTFSVGRLLRDGMQVAIVGRPNVGKSSLFNRLVGANRAIVTEIPGTTRDSISEQIVLNDVAIHLTDTAGVRIATDRIETFGVERTRRIMADADLLLVVVDGSHDLLPEDVEVLKSTEERKRIIVINKSDVERSKEVSLNGHGSTSSLIHVSALTGDGLEDLGNAIVDPKTSSQLESEGLLIRDARHHDLLRQTQTEIENALQLMDARVSEELVMVGLHNALRCLGEITGETTREDILSRIFSTFCIGK